MQGFLVTCIENKPMIAFTEPMVTFMEPVVVFIEPVTAFIHRTGDRGHGTGDNIPLVHFQARAEPPLFSSVNAERR